MRGINVFPETVFTLGPVNITDTVITTWHVMAIITIIAMIAGRRLSMFPSPFQEALEAIVEATEKTIREIAPIDPWAAVPLSATLWIFIGFCNLAGLVPGLKTPTADLNTTLAFAFVSFSTGHIFGIKTKGFRKYLLHYRDPSWILLPFHLVAEFTRTLALAIRLFGNMMSGEMVALILLAVAGFLVPVPFQILHIIIGLIQAYIFGVLTLVFAAGGLGSNDKE